MSGILPVSGESLRARLRSVNAVIVGCAVLGSVALIALLILGGSGSTVGVAVLDDTAMASWLPAVAGGDVAIAPARVPIVAGIGAASTAVLALLALLAAVRAQRPVEAALAFTDQVQVAQPDQLSAIHIADLVEQMAVVEARVPRARQLATAAFSLALVTVFLLADAWLIGTDWIALVAAGLLAIAGGLLLLVGPLVLLGVAIGQGVRAVVARTTGAGDTPDHSGREAAGRRWSSLVIAGTYRVDLASEPVQIAFRRSAPQWLAEVTRIAGRVHSALQAQLREKPDNPLKGVPSGTISKWGEKLNALDKELFDPGRVGPRHVNADDVRLKVDRDYIHYTITITSSTGGQFPGESTLDSGGELKLPDWAVVTPMIESLAIAGSAKSGKKKKDKDKKDD